MKKRGAVFLFLSVLAALWPACTCRDPASPLVHDFEGRGGIGKWPGDAPGECERSTAWKADGEASLRIDPGLLATVKGLYRTDFRGFDALRVHVHNPSPRLVVLGFELTDDRESHHDRHKTSFGAPPGDSVVDIDLTGGLWRGEENRPYRGPTKAPLDLGKISRIAFENRGSAPVHVDALTLVNDPLPAPPGAFAFDFGKRGSRVMGHTTGVFEDSKYEPSAGFGFVSGKPSALRNFMSYPSPLLGDGLAWEDAVFRVDLPGGAYQGWIAFERGGFYEDEATGYSEATLHANGAEVHRHTFSPAGPHFLFQDVEVTRVADVEKLLVWPAHAVHRFTFTAAAGANTFALRVVGTAGPPLRVAGLFLAPATPEGTAFIDAQEERQRRALRAAFPERDDARRPAQAAPLDHPLVVEPRPLGEPAHPGDQPESPIPDMPVITAVAGHSSYAQLSLHAPADVDVDVTFVPGERGIPGPRVYYGWYGPKRPYSGGAAWIETQSYRPDPPGGALRVGPGLSRSVLLGFDVPRDTPPGRVELTVKLSVRGEDLVELPVVLDVVAVDLPPLPIPVGLFMNSLPFGPETLGNEDGWWLGQRRLLRLQGEAGLNTLTGGPGLEYEMSEAGGEASFSGERALRYLALAKELGLDRAVVCYSGFLRSIKHRRPDAARFQRAWAAFEAAHALPHHYLYSYDEPSTPDELAAVAQYLGPFREAGVRTIGFLSRADEDRFRPLFDATFAPAVSGHTLEQVQRWVGDKRHLFLYNRGTTRLSMGADLHRMIRLGVSGRLEWIGLYTQGFAFHDLDGREPSYGMFLVDDRARVFFTPRWLSLREGLVDARVRLALDAALPPGESGPPWPTEYPADPRKWPDGALDAARASALKRLSAGPATR